MAIPTNNNIMTIATINTATTTATMTVIGKELPDLGMTKN
jgi:hypothetical protein